jgi:serine/threonine protein kinase
MEANQEVIIKVLSNKALETDEGIAHFQKEIDTMLQMRSDDIVRLLDVFWDRDYYYMVFPWFKSRDLGIWIRKNGPLKEDMAAYIFEKLVAAVGKLHREGIVHRLLQPAHVLIKEGCTPVLTGFAMCEKENIDALEQEKWQTSTGLAPECLVNGTYDGVFADIWSLGVILYTMVVGQDPFVNERHRTTIEQILHAAYTIPGNISPECAQLIERMLQIRPQNRITLGKIVSSKWIKRADRFISENIPNLKPEEDVCHLISIGQNSLCTDEDTMRSPDGIILHFTSESMKLIIANGGRRRSSGAFADSGPRHLPMVQMPRFAATIRRPSYFRPVVASSTMKPCDRILPILKA